MNFRLFLVLLTLGLAGFVVWKVLPRSVPRDDVVARVGSEVITVDEFRSAAALRRGISGTPPDPSALLEEIIDRKAAVDRARKLGLEQDPEVVREIESILIGRLRKRFETERPSAPDEPSSADLQKMYEAAASEFEIPERRQIAGILFRREAGADESSIKTQMRELEALRTQIVQANDGTAAFADAAVRLSGDRTSRYQGGDLGWFELGRDSSLSLEILGTAFRLERAGDVAAPLETKDGLWLVRLVAIEKKKTRSFEETAPTLRHRWMAARQKEAVDAFRMANRKDVSIEIYRDRLRAIPSAPVRAGATAEPPLPQF